MKKREGHGVTGHGLVHNTSETLSSLAEYGLVQNISETLSSLAQGAARLSRRRGRVCVVFTITLNLIFPWVAVDKSIVISLIGYEASIFLCILIEVVRIICLVVLGKSYFSPCLPRLVRHDMKIELVRVIKAPALLGDCES